MNAKSNGVRNGIILLGAGICFGLGFFAAKKLAQPVHIVETQPGPATFITNVVTVIQKTPAAENNQTPAGKNWNNDEWQQLAAEMATPDRNAQLAALLEKLAAVDPRRAMAMAQQEGNLQFRKELIQSVLHGWARTVPQDAANWVMTQPNTGERDAQLSTVFAGAVATDPNSAVAVGKALMQQFPGDAISCGSRLVDALCDSGNFSVAADFAVNGSSDQRDGLMSEAFSKWAAYQPQAAAQAAQAIGDPDIRNQAIHGIVGGWAEADPAGLVQFLGQLPAGGDRGQMLGQALRSWAQTDPTAVANWVQNNSNLGPDLDQGVAEVATLDSLPKDFAVAWGESISDPQLRSSTLASVVRDWAYSDLPAAQNYFQNTTNLSATDRQQLSEVFADMARNAATQASASTSQ